VLKTLRPVSSRFPSLFRLAGGGGGRRPQDPRQTSLHQGCSVHRLPERIDDAPDPAVMGGDCAGADQFDRVAKPDALWRLIGQNPRAAGVEHHDFTSENAGVAADCHPVAHAPVAPGASDAQHAAPHLGDPRHLARWPVSRNFCAQPGERRMGHSVLPLFLITLSKRIGVKA